MIDLHETYTLDGILLRCTKVKDGLGVFQEVHADGTPKIEYKKNSQGEEISIVDDWGVRIVGDRIRELKHIS